MGKHRLAFDAGRVSSGHCPWDKRSTSQRMRKTIPISALVNTRNHIYNLQVVMYACLEHAAMVDLMALRKSHPLIVGC